MDEWQDQLTPRPSPGVFCPSCGYDLRGSPIGGVCPECRYDYSKILQITQETGSSGFAVTSLVLGILSIVGCTGYGLPGLLFGIPGWIFGHYAIRRVDEGRAPASSRGMAKAGRICSIIGVSLSALAFAAVLFMLVIVTIP
ncbi:MAG: DUF4190 domain-containing protein [Planctomycetota bacterium]